MEITVYVDPELYARLMSEVAQSRPNTSKEFAHCFIEDTARSVLEASAVNWRRAVGRLAKTIDELEDEES